MPARGVSVLDIEAGAASINIRVPEATAARIRVKEGVTAMNVDTNRFPQLDTGMYQSANFDSATDRAEITIESGLGSVTIKVTSVIATRSEAISNSPINSCLYGEIEIAMSPLSRLTA